MRYLEKFSLKTTLASLALLGSLSVGFGNPSSNEVDYSQGIIKSHAIACSNPQYEFFPDELKKAQALEAARTVAQKNLLEALKGVKIDAVTTVNQLMLNNSLILKTVGGVLRGAVECPDEPPKYFGNPNSKVQCAQVCMMVKFLYNANGVKMLIPILKEYKKAHPEYTQPPTPEKLAENKEKVEKISEEVKPKEYDGVIIDAREISYEPQLMPVIMAKSSMDEAPKVVFAPAMVDEKYVQRKGAVVANVATDTQLQTILQKWGIKHPLKVKATAYDDVTGGIIISRDDAIKIAVANEKTHFLEKGNVIILFNPSAGSLSLGP